MFDTFEEDDLVAEVELVAQARYSQNNDADDAFDAEGNLFFFTKSRNPPFLVVYSSLCV